MHDIKALRRVLEYNAEAAVETTTSEQWPEELERRRWQRLSYRAEGTGTLVKREGGVPVTLKPGFPIIAQDLSRGGTSFLANYDLQLNDVVELQVPNADGSNRQLSIRVTRNRRVGLGAYEIGGEFTDGDEQDDFA
jgi:hypothetical protein